jgi:hypothetical protein
VAGYRAIDETEEDAMQAWIDRLAESLGEPALSSAESGRLLVVSRDVAHRVERKVTPLAAFLLGSAVGRRMAAGTSRSDALAEALASLEAVLPEAPEEA